MLLMFIKDWWCATSATARIFPKRAHPGSRRSDISRVTVAAGVRKRFKDEGPEPTLARCNHFCDSVKSRQPYWENATAGHHAAACAHMVNQSASQHRTVEWDFAKDDIRG